MKNASSYEHQHLNLKGYGEVGMHQFFTSGKQLFKFSSDRIVLICVREGILQMTTQVSPTQIDVHSGEAIFLANPSGEWSLHWNVTGPSTIYVINLEMTGFHKLLGVDMHRGAHSGTKSFQDLQKRIAVNPSQLMGFEMMMHHKLHPPYSTIYEQGKFLEQFSLIMDAAFGPTDTSCPVALTPATERKLYEIRRYIMQSIEEEPDPDFLALEYDISRLTLREGFKYLFGKTLHQFHADHKLEWAMQQLTEGDYLVKELAFAVGYQNPSHFIAAFKKKFGFTPKQFLKRNAIVEA